MGLRALPASTWVTFGCIVLGLLVMAFCWRTRWHRAAAWFALLLVAQACTLQLILAGPQVRLQMFYDWSALLRSHRSFFLAAVLMQALVVAWGGRALWSRTWRTLRQLISWPQALLFLILLGYSAATIPPELAQAFVSGVGFGSWLVRHLTKVALAFLIHAAAAGNLFLLIAAIPKDAWATWLDRWKKVPITRWVWTAALWVVIASSLLHWFALRGIPHVPDEVAYVFHAKYISAGNLYLPPPQDVQTFPCRFCTVDGGKWYSVMLQGWPFALALGYRAGVPWLVNPLLGAIGILLSYLFVKWLYDERLALGTVLLLAASPWYLFMSASLMPHPLSFVLALVGFLGVHHAREEGSIIWSSAAGLAFGGLLHVRPLEAVAVAGVAGLWWLAAGWKRLRLGALLATTLAGLLMTMLFLAYNRALTGDPWRLPVDKFFDETYYKGAYRLGFGINIGSLGWTGIDALPGHGPIDVFMNTNQNLYMTNFDLFGWGLGSLVFFFLLMVRRWQKIDGFMWGIFLALVAATNLFWYSGVPDFAARYWYVTILPLAVLTLRGAGVLDEKAQSAGADGTGARKIWAGICVVSLAGLITVMPWRTVDKYRHYRGMRPDVRELARKYQFGRSLVFIRGQGGPEYASAFVLNPPTYESAAPGTLYALETSPEERKRVEAMFPDRPVWVIAGPSVTHAGYQVVEGPLPPTGGDGAPSPGPH